MDIRHVPATGCEETDPRLNALQLEQRRDEFAAVRLRLALQARHLRTGTTIFWGHDPNPIVRKMESEALDAPTDSQTEGAHLKTRNAMETKRREVKNQHKTTIKQHI